MAEKTERQGRGVLSRLPFYSLLVLISSLGFIQLGYPLFGKSAVVTDVFFLITAGCFVIALLVRQLDLRWDGFFWVVIIYLLGVGVSTPFSTNPRLSLTTFPIEIYLVCLSFITFGLIDTTGRLKAAVLAWLIGTGFAVALGLSTLGLFYLDRSNPLLEYLTYHYGAVPVGNFPRITATFASASMFCNYLNVSLILAILALYKNWLWPSVAYLLVAAVLICSVFTVSVGLGGILLALGLVTIIVYRSNAFSVKALAVGGAIAALGFLVVSVFALAYYPNAEIWATVAEFRLMPSSRSLVWRDALNTFGQHPIVGTGLGVPVAGIIFTNTDGSGSLLTDAHNSYLNIAAQSGLMGLIGLLAVTIAILRRWINMLSASTALAFTPALGLAFVCSFVYQGLMGSFEEARHLWVLIGMFVAAYRVENNP